jgi:hypothetical protein
MGAEFGAALPFPIGSLFDGKADVPSEIIRLLR